MTKTKKKMRKRTASKKTIEQRLAALERTVEMFRVSDERRDNANSVHLGELHGSMSRLVTEHAQLRQYIEGRLDAIIERISGRVAQVESSTRHLGDRVDNHEKRIIVLEAKP